MISKPYCQSGATKSKDQKVLNACMLLFPFLDGDKREVKKKEKERAEMIFVQMLSQSYLSVIKENLTRF